MGKRIIKTKEFELPIYASNMIFVYSNSYAEIEEFAREQNLHKDDILKLSGRDWKGYSFNVVDNNNNGYYYIFVIKDKDKYNEIDTIAHEVAHTVRYILQNKGVKYSSNDEPFAYLTGYINKEFFKFKDNK